MRWTVTVVGLALAACGPAPQVQADAGVPNRPPRIVSTEPALRSTWYSTTACVPLNPAIRLTVDDEDGDTLRSLWFIDQTASSEPFFTSPTGGGTVTAPSAQRFQAELANLPSGVHLLTVYVSDSDFDEVIDGMVTVHRPVGVGYLDSYTWVLDVEPCP